MKKRIAKILSVVLASAMCLTSGVTAFAANSTGDASAPAKATIVKELQIPNGTTVPAATFKFTATSDTTDAIAPIVKQVSFTADDTATSEKVYKTVDLFSDVTWTHAGVYEYTVTETKNTYTAGDKEVMTYSGAEYKLTVVVVNGDDDSLYIKEIAAQKTKDDAGDEITTQTKVDPNPTDASNPTEGGIRFVNTYVKGGSIVDPDNPDETDPTESLMTITKNVAGDLGDKVTAFEFTVSASNPSIAPAKDQTVQARILSKDGKTWKANAFTVGQNQKVSLAHGEKLVFLNLYAGATVSFQETDTIAKDKYTVTANVTNGVATVTYTKNASGKDVVTNDGVTVTPISEDKASAIVTNTLDSTSPTGILINNLPFILLILVAVVGFVGYVSAKRRRVSGN